MPEPSRVEMLTVLAVLGMGWQVHTTRNLSGREVTWAEKPDGRVVYLDPCVATESDWSPDTDGRAAFELLARLGARESDLWSVFCQRLLSMVTHRTGPDLGTGGPLLLPRDMLVALASSGPALIARAAFEALEASHE